MNPKQQPGKELPPPARLLFPGGFWEVLHTSAGPKGYRIARTSHRGTWVYEISPQAASPDGSMLTLVRAADAWTASFDLSCAGFAIRGDVPLQVCPANTVAKD